jgi:uracil-DNA glycosylase family 4
VAQKNPATRDTLRLLNDDITACRACPRLVRWREAVARERRAAYRDEQYWGKPIAGFGDPAARIVVLGLAPGAHGANRTGRVFTGDRSGDWLFRAMHRAGLANQATSQRRDDGLALRDAWVTVVVRCAPPDNKPLPLEKKRCGAYLSREFALLAQARAVVCLGNFAYAAACEHFAVSPRPKFAHGAVVDAGRVALVCSYHPSQQNTFTGRLTEAMLDGVFATAVRLAR